jgi:hypothetical protein
MIRSFCFGAILGFAFGTSKQGTQVRQSIDGFLSALLKNDENDVLNEEDSLNQSEKPTRFERGRSNSGSRGNGRGQKHEAGSAAKEDSMRESKRTAAVAEHKQESNEATSKRNKKDESAAPMDKMHEMAEALSAKPIAPETDELEPS